MDCQVRVHASFCKTYFRGAKKAFRRWGKRYWQVSPCIGDSLWGTQHRGAQTMWGHRSGVEHQRITRWDPTQVSDSVNLSWSVNDSHVDYRRLFRRKSLTSWSSLSIGQAPYLLPLPHIQMRMASRYLHGMLMPEYINIPTLIRM